MALYSHTTLAALRTALSNKLGDSDFWITAELDLYLKEALRWWGAHTLRWKKRENLALTTSQHWYDLYSESTELNPSVTDQDLLVEIEYHLLETIDDDAWSGSTQYTLSRVQTAMQGALDEFYFAVCPVLTKEEVTGAGMVDIHDLSGVSGPIVDIHRAAFKDASGNFTTLWRTDGDEVRSYQFNQYNTQEDSPHTYSIGNMQPLEVMLSPRSNQPGVIEYVFQKSAPTLDLTTGVELGIPDDLSWVIKYGTLAELLDQEGMATDSRRAAYCRKRFEDGLEIARQYPSAVGAQINGVPVQIGRTRDTDAYNADWQNEADSTPERVFFSGYNLFAVAPSPDAGPHAVLFDLVQPAVIPASDTDNIQLDKQEIEAVVSYAQHIASFKQGGREFADTNGQMADAMRMATQKNGQLATQQWAKDAQDSRTWDELVMSPVKEYK